MSAAGTPPTDRDLCDCDWVTPIRRSGYMDWTVDHGWRMLWQFWYADGSSKVTRNPRAGFRLTERMMKAGLIEPEFGDAARAKKTREIVCKIISNTRARS